MLAARDARPAVGDRWEAKPTPKSDPGDHARASVLRSADQSRFGQPFYQSQALATRLVCMRSNLADGSVNATTTAEGVHTRQPAEHARLALRVSFVQNASWLSLKSIPTVFRTPLHEIWERSAAPVLARILHHRLRVREDGCGNGTGVAFEPRSANGRCGCRSNADFAGRPCACWSEHRRALRSSKHPAALASLPESHFRNSVGTS